MIDLTRETELLHRYHDGELSGLERVLFERRLRRSPALRDELRAIEGVSAAIEQIAPSTVPPDVPDLWPSIAPTLPSIDAQVADERAGAAQRATRETGSRAGWPGFAFGRPHWAAGAAALAAAAVVALVLVVQSPGGPTAAGTAAVAPVLAGHGGVIRYLDSGGASVMVIEDEAADMTIVWMMDGA